MNQSDEEPIPGPATPPAAQPRVRGTFARRLLTIPGYVLGWSAWCAALPLLLLLALLVDAFRRPRVALRSVAMVTFYLSLELLGLAISAALWLWKLASGMAAERWRGLHFRLEAWWGATLFRAVAWIFGLTVEVESDDAELGRGPYLLLLRHSSMGDTLLASALVALPHRIRLRYVLKRELLWDPCLDVVGHRIPNVFVDRGAEDSASEIRSVGRLGEALDLRDGVLIYPEGTRFTESKRRRLVEKLRTRGDTELHEYASSLEQLLPPRTAGTLALLDAAPEADVVLCAHTGFEASGSVGEIWSGRLLGRTIRVRFERIAHTRIPGDRSARVAWLRAEWKRIDAWVAAHREPRAASET